MSTVLVTGGTGLIGAEVVRQLLQEGHRPVAFEFSPNLANIADIQDDVPVVRGDVVDMGSLMHAVREHGVDRIIHLAAFILHESNSNPMRSAQVNVMGSGNIFDLALALGIERVTYASTSAVFGRTELYGSIPATEEDAPAPANPYGGAKRLVEIIADNYATNLGLDVIGLRPALTYGIGRLTGGTGGFNRMVRGAALGLPVELDNYGPPERLIQPLYIRDMARAFVRANLGPKLPLTIYNAPVGDPITVQHAVDTVREIVPDAQIEIVNRQQPGAWASPTIDGARFRLDAGFASEVSLHDGVAEMVEIFRHLEAGAR